jgi:two-component system chemotaxis response regulator CheY
MCLTKLLNKYGYKVIEAKDGVEAVKTYRKANPDAVFMDFAMPRKNGLDALSEIRKFDPKAKVIMLTALGQQAITLRAMQSGAKDFLMKPYEPEKVVKTLQKVLG